MPFRIAIAFTGLFAIIANFGMNNYIIRELARNKEQTSEYLTNVSVIKLILSILAFGFIVLTINIMDYPQDTTYAVYLFGIYMIFVLFVIFSGYGLIELAYVYIFVGIVAVTLSFAVVLIKIAKPKRTIDFSLWKTLIIGSIPFALNADIFLS
ncbi:hypothetical protein C5S30_03070 [ANME-1 cluster archaeon GoMg4]|nr:hypothetical protein [ANME-1 cluster archaeon GoMg4]